MTRTVVVVEGSGLHGCFQLGEPAAANQFTLAGWLDSYACNQHKSSALVLAGSAGCA